MTRSEVVFKRIHSWIDRHARSINGALILLPIAIFGVADYTSGSLAIVFIYLLFTPLVMMMATSMLFLTVIPPIALIAHFAEKLAARGWSYWLAFVLIAPLGVPVDVLMIYP